MSEALLSEAIRRCHPAELPSFCVSVFVIPLATRAASGDPKNMTEHGARNGLPKALRRRLGLHRAPSLRASTPARYSPYMISRLRGSPVSLGSGRSTLPHSRPLPCPVDR